MKIKSQERILRHLLARNLIKCNNLRHRVLNGLTKKNFEIEYGVSIDTQLFEWAITLSREIETTGIYPLMDKNSNLIEGYELGLNESTMKIFRNY